MSDPSKVDFDLIILGGGAAGMFGGIRTLELSPTARVVVLEKSSQLLSKVKVSGGGRCNVTHAAFEEGELVKFYPRGAKELRGAFSRFQPRDMVEWLSQKGVLLKTEADGRMFPTTDNSQSIIQCFTDTASQLGLGIRRGLTVDSIRKEFGVFCVSGKGTELRARNVLVAVGGMRAGAITRSLESLGHRIAPLAPSLFTFKMREAWVKALAGLSLPSARIRIPEAKIETEGPLLFTHWGLSGPVVLKASAWGARSLAECEYRFRVVLDFMPDLKEESLRDLLRDIRQSHGKALIKNARPESVPQRLWEALLSAVGEFEGLCWNQVPRKAFNQLLQRLKCCELEALGKSMNKEEFVTCGGVSLKEVDFKRSMSLKEEGLYFAGECLDVDGLTGGFNFQAAWTTAEMAARSISASLSDRR